MIQIKYSPQCSDKTISYQFQGDKITAIIDGEPQTVDLSNISQYPTKERQTPDPPFFILSVRVVDEAKRVELLKFHRVDAPENERFGFEWEEV